MYKQLIFLYLNLNTVLFLRKNCICKIIINILTIANETLYESIQENPDLARELGLSSFDIQGLMNGETPKGYTWHHHEQPGVIQLVDSETHENTGHTGGREIWGGGSDHR
ncbi:HNH endonuclease [Metabacillus fastidiosus]|uniref:HNH endonuclease n=1 Tax=Metabacillus fastidiosus TaxID=1458 RepID=UPI0009EDE035|nr:HNH endonuclease [Metabacillus fastidiosus]MED4462700.1 HNH endonuclease [Metabacillus fastidiosus]